MSFETLTLEKSDGIATITLNRPKALNALNMQMGRELLAASIDCDEDSAVRAVLLKGSGRAFCAGGDVTDFAKQGDDAPAFIKELTTYLHGAISRFVRGDAPVIAEVHGAVAGAGLGLVCMSDLAIAADTAKFTTAYQNIGLTPDGSSTYFLPRLVGFRRAQELFLTPRTLSADEAADWGIVTRVVTENTLTEEASKLASKVASGPTLAYGRAKALLTSSTSESLETQMELESRGIATSAGSDDFREGLSAFAEKRKADFRGQ